MPIRTARTVWVTANGREMNLEVMGDRHLLNSYLLTMRNLIALETIPEAALMPITVERRKDLNNDRMALLGEMNRRNATKEYVPDEDRPHTSDGFYDPAGRDDVPF